MEQMIWKNNPTLEGINMLGKNSLSGHMGIEFTEIGTDYLRATMPVDHRTKQPMGLLHGGASVALAETMGSVASVLSLDDIGSASVVGVEINANHLKSAKSGYVTATVRPVKIGRTLHIWDIKITNDNKDLVCVSRLTIMVLKK